MSKVEQLYRRPGSTPILQSVHSGIHIDHEAELLAELLRRNGRQERVVRATPPGYRYMRLHSRSALPVSAAGPIVQIAAHPGDGPDFFYASALQMARNSNYRYDFHEIILTDGAGGVDGWSPDYTRQIRAGEAYAGAHLVQAKLHLLNYPDGELTSLSESRRGELIARLTAILSDLQPAIIVVHSSQKDHPDHAASFLLTLAALRRYVPTSLRLPTLLVHDVEFGLAQEPLWTSPYSGDKFTLSPFNSPNLIVDISETHALAQQALHRHQTQMRDPLTGQPKSYADLIDILAQVRGLQCANSRAKSPLYGQGFTHLVIPHLTSKYNLLPQRLPLGTCYQRVRCDLDC